MRVAPTLDNSLRIDAESPFDWLILEMICTDAANLPGPPLAKRLANKIKDKEDWTEFVIPDLHSQFSEQVNHVSLTLSAANKNDDLTGSIYIPHSDADIWYGAINQARISLEHQYEISRYADITHIEEISEERHELRKALIRYHFYTRVQSMLLEYIIE